MADQRRSRIVIVEDVALEAKLLSRTLTDFGYSEVACEADIEGAMARVEGGARLVLTDLELGGQSGLDLARRIRARKDAGYVYVIVVTGHGAGRLEEAFAAGADDFLTKPYRVDELRARLRAAERILDLESLLRTRASELETALRRIDVAAASRALERAAAVREGEAFDNARPLESLSRLKLWLSLEETVGRSLEGFLGLAQTPSTDRGLRGEPFTAEIMLNEASLGLEIAVTVSAASETIEALSMQLLGEAEPEAGQALVLEAANVVMGALKTELLGQGFTFVGGLPAATPYATATSILDAAPVRRRFVLSSAAGIIEVGIRARRCKNVTVRVRDLREGMVVSEDVRDARGMLLIRAGTRLTQSTTERLARLAPDVSVAVSDPGLAAAA
jgi:CheY-like chemotaxis protein